MTAMPAHEAFQNASVDANYVFTVEAEIQKLGLGLHSSASYADARDALVATIGNVCHFTGHYSGANLERVLSKVETATTGHRVVAVLLIRCISIERLLLSMPPIRLSQADSSTAQRCREPCRDAASTAIRHHCWSPSAEKCHCQIRRLHKRGLFRPADVHPGRLCRA